MMESFSIFLPEGIRHITDLNGIDHILFITVLCLRYTFGEWKKLLVLITAFTIGHSITLALSTLDIFTFSRDLTEFFIAVTILITAISNFFFRQQQKQPVYFYLLAIFFGLIHGLGFSTLLKSMLGTNTSVIAELFAFNLGIEIGQIVIVTVILAIAYFSMRILKVHQRAFILVVSGVIAALSLQIAIERFPKKREINDETTVMHLPYGSFCAVGKSTGYTQ